MKIEFIRTTETVQVQKEGKVLFHDSLDHYLNGIVRLLGVPEVELERFIKMAAVELEFSENLEYESWIKILSECWSNSFPETIKPVAIEETLLGESAAEFISSQMLRFRASSIEAIIHDQKLDYGRLVDANTLHPINATTHYEEDYFLGGVERVGYGNIDSQEWRSEKSNRLANRVLSTPGLQEKKDLRILDIGSGYGQFVKSLHRMEVHSAFGLDISVHAAKRAKDELNVQTFVCELQDLNKHVDAPFNVATMWDYIEHPTNPAIDLHSLYSLLTPGAFLFIKTPNLDCPEFSIFHNYYHSLKREHLHYFSPNSLQRLLESNGFSIQICETSSHILQGFREGLLTKEAVRNNRGSDIFVVARRA
jgi:2-polyprenyl-3-methyl-5-hydroxy-6-metoxy-1,4-benzoquinol methylase